MPTSRKPYPTDLSDDRWALIEPILTAWRADRRAKGLEINEAKHELREIVNAILYVNRTGIGWPHLPHDFPPHQSVYIYFRAWANDGTTLKIQLNTITTGPTSLTPKLKTDVRVLGP